MPKIIIYLALVSSLFSIANAKHHEDTKKVLFLAGAPSHGPGYHEHRAGSILLAKALNESGLHIEASVVNIWPEDSSVFEDVDAIVIYADAGGKYAAERYATLDEKVKAGTGIMFIHYGVHPKQDIGETYYALWTGGFFETGYSVNPHWTADLTPKAGHPIGNGIDAPVVANDEFYYNIRFPEPKCCEDEFHTLVDAQLDADKINIYNNLWTVQGDALIGSRVGLMWSRDAKNQGRGVGFTGGHFHRNWADDGFRQLVLNAIVWTARVEVPKNGVSSKPISDEQLNANLDGVPAEPLTKPTPESLSAFEPMLRPRDPANYNRKAHREWVKEMKAKK